MAHDSHVGVSARYVRPSTAMGSRMTYCTWDLKIQETFPIGCGNRDIGVDFLFVVTLLTRKGSTILS
ncbi:hypothetical protein [Streptomyces sp. NPDC002159]